MNKTKKLLILSLLLFLGLNTAHAKQLDVIGYLIVVTGPNPTPGPMGGTTTVIKCAIVSSSICFTITVPEVSNINYATHNGPISPSENVEIMAAGLLFPIMLNVSNKTTSPLFDNSGNLIGTEHNFTGI